MKLLPFGVLLLALSACGGGGNSLEGTAVRDFDLSFDRVLIQQQESDGEPNAVRVRYVRDVQGQPEFPVTINVDWPVEEGVEIDLVRQGSVTRTTTDGSTFPELSLGTITFGQFGQVGQTVSGEFFATFVSGGTLSGNFEGPLTLLSF